MTDEEQAFLRREVEEVDRFIGQQLPLYVPDGSPREVLVVIVAGDALDPRHGRWNQKLRELDEDARLAALDERTRLVGTLIEGVRFLTKHDAGEELLNAFAACVRFPVLFVTRPGESLLRTLVQDKEQAGAFSTLIDYDTYVGPSRVVFVFQDEYSSFVE